MKVTSNKGPATQTSGDMVTTAISISQDEGDMTMIMDVLTSTLYTDKVSACLREYGCNGFDANVEAGHRDKPIKVRLPNKLEQSLSIRDFGAGMDKEQIAKVFCQLGRSTKRNSNEFTGMLGIGSKAGFAYGDQFMVISFVKGKRVIYNAYRDQGKPQLAQMSEEATTEPDGLEIKIPVRQLDIPEFARKAERVYRYFKLLPDISGAQITFKDRKHEFGGTGWRFTGNGESVAIMGNVGYNLDGNAMGLPMDWATNNYYYSKGSMTAEQKMAMLVKAGVELDFNIGELEIAANREGLQYKDQTKKAISDKMKVLLAEIADVFSKKMASAKTLWEAKLLWNELYTRASNAYGNITLEQLIAQDLKWNNIPIKDAKFDLSNKESTAGVTVTHFNLSARRNPLVYGASTYNYYTYSNPREILANKSTTFVLNDLPNKKQSPTRIKGYFEQNPSFDNLMVFTFDNDASKKEYLKNRSIDESQLVKYSGFPTYVPPPSNAAPSAHRAKHGAKVFSLDEARLGGQYDTRSSFWTTQTVDLKTDSGVYVVLEAFWVKSPVGGIEHPTNFINAVKRLRKAGLITTPIYGFKVSIMDKLGSKWRKLQDVIQENYDKLAKTTNIGQEIADSNAALQHRPFMQQKYADKFPAKSLMHIYLKELARMNGTSLPEDLRTLICNGSAGTWLKLPSNLPKPTTDLAKEQQKLYAKYPLLQMIGVGQLSGVTGVALQAVVDYVSLTESIKTQKANV